MRFWKVAGALGVLASVVLVANCGLGGNPYGNSKVNPNLQIGVTVRGLNLSETPSMTWSLYQSKEGTTWTYITNGSQIGSAGNDKIYDRATCIVDEYILVVYNVTVAGGGAGSSQAYIYATSGIETCTAQADVSSVATVQFRNDAGAAGVNPEVDITQVCASYKVACEPVVPTPTNDDEKPYTSCDTHGDFAVSAFWLEPSGCTGLTMDSSFCMISIGDVQTASGYPKLETLSGGGADKKDVTVQTIYNYLNTSGQLIYAVFPFSPSDTSWDNAAVHVIQSPWVVHVVGATNDTSWVTDNYLVNSWYYSPNSTTLPSVGIVVGQDKTTDLYWSTAADCNASVDKSTPGAVQHYCNPICTAGQVSASALILATCDTSISNPCSPALSQGTCPTAPAGEEYATPIGTVPDSSISTAFDIVYQCQ